MDVLCKTNQIKHFHTHSTAENFTTQSVCGLSPFAEIHFEMPFYVSQPENENGLDIFFPTNSHGLTPLKLLFCLCLGNRFCLFFLFSSEAISLNFLKQRRRRWLADLPPLLRVFFQVSQLWVGKPNVEKRPPKKTRAEAARVAEKCGLF